MKGTVLKEAYELLRNIGSVANEVEFSRDWLGRGGRLHKDAEIQGGWCEHRPFGNL